jgi:hypothetical protein
MRREGTIVAARRYGETEPFWRWYVMTLNLLLIQPLVALIAGILILIIPRLLNYIVAIYLIIVGLAGLSPHLLR